MRRLFSTFLIIHLCSSINAQIANTGLIIPKNKQDIHSEKYCCVLSPAVGFKVFDNPNGKLIGTLKKEKDNYSMNTLLNDKKIQFDDYEEIGYELYALKFNRRHNNFIKLSGKNNYWLSIDEINKTDFAAIDWMTFLVGNSSNVLGYYANEPGLKLRRTPDINGEILGSVRGELFEIKLTNRTSGNWCFVKITKFKEHPCQTELEDVTNIEFKMEGWIKVLNDNREPNIWSYTKGC